MSPSPCSVVSSFAFAVHRDPPLFVYFVFFVVPLVVKSFAVAVCRVRPFSAGSAPPRKEAPFAVAVHKAAPFFVFFVTFVVSTFRRSPLPKQRRRKNTLLSNVLRPVFVSQPVSSEWLPTDLPLGCLAMSKQCPSNLQATPQVTSFQPKGAVVELLRCWVASSILSLPFSAQSIAVLRALRGLRGESRPPLPSIRCSMLGVRCSAFDSPPP